MNSRKVKPDTIVNIAYQLLCQKGIDALTVNHIAAAGKFSTYPIYYNFSTIEGLQEQAINLLVKKIRKSLPVIVDKNIRDIGQAIFRFIKDKPGLVRSFFADKDFYTTFNNKILDLFTGTPASRIELQFNLAVIFSSVKFLHNYPKATAEQVMQGFNEKLYSSSASAC